ncbi:MAG: OmpA family protein, partial [Myxococcota bacterium]
FRLDNFLLVGDTNQRATGDLSIGIVPMDNLEIFALYQTMATSNTKAVPQLQLSQGNFIIGAKYSYPVIKSLGVGGLVSAGLNTLPGDSFYSASATALNIKLVATFDGRQLEKPLPLRVHVNAGTYLIFTDNAVSKSWEHYLLNLDEQKAGVFGVGLDFPIDKYGLLPFLEVYFKVPDGPAYATPGVKWKPFPDFDLSFDLMCDIGLFYGTPQKAVTTQTYNIIAGITLGGGSQKTKVIKQKYVEKVVEKVPDSALNGAVKGLAVDVDTEAPLGDVIISMPGSGLTNMATDPVKGDFLAPSLKPGPYTFTASRNGYDPATARVEVKTGQTAPVKLALKRKVVEGTAYIKVIDDRGKVMENVEVQAFSGSKAVDLKRDKDGRFVANLEAGQWYIVAKSEGKISTGRVVEVVAQKGVEVDIALKGKPKENLISVEKDRILLLKQIHFAQGSSQIMGDSFSILELVVDAINSNPKIKKVKIEGHTDDKGVREANIVLSRERANSVRNYLIKWGLKPELLEAEGFGPDRPIESNKTTRGCEANRRVEFILLEH